MSVNFLSKQQIYKVDMLPLSILFEHPRVRASRFALVILLTQKFYLLWRYQFLVTIFCKL
ncbi:hypothetical protein WA1_45945 [Scytonema hofmannii PCC 7110]|uniref:Uncharacterized protein n=1 Tax=Scytonema hofmannii PCC 7110 TaxID=128403 RepID=A0A139WX25_9CYAN|nr:hypothetical protein WA1_45945 [Scytonema hofmannii PCC 7110]